VQLTASVQGLLERAHKVAVADFAVLREVTAMAPINQDHGIKQVDNDANLAGAHEPIYVIAGVVAGSEESDPLENLSPKHPGAEIKADARLAEWLRAMIASAVRE